MPPIWNMAGIDSLVQLERSYTVNVQIADHVVVQEVLAGYMVLTHLQKMVLFTNMFCIIHTIVLMIMDKSWLEIVVIFMFTNFHIFHIGHANMVCVQYNTSLTGEDLRHLLWIYMDIQWISFIQRSINFLFFMFQFYVSILCIFQHRLTNLLLSSL